MTFRCPRCGFAADPDGSSLALQLADACRFCERRLELMGEGRLRELPEPTGEYPTWGDEVLRELLPG